MKTLQLNQITMTAEKTRFVAFDWPHNEWEITFKRGTQTFVFNLDASVEVEQIETREAVEAIYADYISGNQYFIDFCDTQGVDEDSEALRSYLEAQKNARKFEQLFDGLIRTIESELATNWS